MPKAATTVYSDANYTDGSAVTPSDSTVLSPPFRGLYVAATGVVVVTTLGGTDVTFTGVPAGSILPIVGTKVRATGTTATGIVALY